MFLEFGDMAERASRTLQRLGDSRRLDDRSVAFVDVSLAPVRNLLRRGIF